MKKKIICAVLAAVLVAVAVITIGAYTPDQLRAADALNELELFLGTGNGYELDKSLTRAEGITLLVRILGKETEAKTGTFTMPFTDVPDWAKGYVGYAYKNNITNGMSDTVFGSEEAMTDYMFLTLTLRALGYSDEGVRAKFTWDDPYELAESVGLIPVKKADKDFRRGDAVSIVWNAMEAKLASKDMKLFEKLIQAGVFTKDDYTEAKNVWKNGRQDSESASSTDTTATPTPNIPPVTPPVSSDTTSTPIPNIPPVTPPVSSDTEDTSRVPETEDTSRVPETEDTSSVPETEDTSSVPETEDTSEVTLPPNWLPIG